LRLKGTPPRTWGDIGDAFDDVTKWLGRRLLTLAVEATGRKIAFGNGNYGWPGGGIGSNNTVVTHGLGKTPLVVFVQGGLTISFIITRVVARSTTTFTTNAITVDGSNPPAGQVDPFDWIAIG
jgi:hypothetical protein